ncbi:MAG: hypothetical protein ACREQ5_12240, partial [Candidatus Dormibacteria bacterium]
MLELSQTDLKSYMRCKQYFKYTWTLGRQPKTVPLRVIEGASVHSGLAKLAAGQGPPSGDLIADNYVIHHPLPKVIKSIEEPMFWEYEDFRIRFTPDLLYHNDTNSLVCRDYKTFSRMPSFAPDVDFQCRIYLALSHADYWEYVYIRNVVPGTKKSNGIWKPEECYFTEKVFTDERQRAT